MSRRKRDLSLDAPETKEDRSTARWHLAKGDALLALLPGPLNMGRLISRVGDGTTTARKMIESLLDPMRELGLVECGPTRKYVRDQVWELTPAGRRAARRETQARADQAEREAAREWAIAGRREHLHIHEPVPAGEYRVQRPGAYAHEAWPSRHGDWLHYRDGRVVHISERGDS